MKQDIPHLDAERVLFEARPACEGTIVQCYYGSLVYGDHRSELICFKTYVERIIKIRKNIFLKCVYWLPEMAENWNMEQHFTWIVPTLFWAMHYMNDRKCFPGD